MIIMIMTTMAITSMMTRTISTITTIMMTTKANR
jgi:hypothetical protein